MLARESHPRLWRHVRAQHQAPASLPSQGNHPGKEGNQTRVHKPKELRPGKGKLQTQSEDKACTAHDPCSACCNGSTSQLCSLSKLYAGQGLKRTCTRFLHSVSTAHQLHGTDTGFNQLPS